MSGPVLSHHLNRGAGVVVKFSLPTRRAWFAMGLHYAPGADDARRMGHYPGEEYLTLGEIDVSSLGPGSLI